MTIDLAIPAAPDRLAAGGGCAAKMGPGALATMLSLSGLTEPPAAGPDTVIPGADVLVGLRTGDDAAVIRLTNDLAIVQTVDFFTPVVSDPETFGAIAAANAMSDVFAMGGEVMTALSILAVPEGLDPSIPAAILRGAAAKVREAGGQIVGGHTIYDPQVKFGLAVTGRVHPDRYWARTTARPGDHLFLTKALGTALIMTADRAGDALPIHVQSGIDSMLRLNRDASRIASPLSPDAVTDVTGFGLLGHLAEMVTRSGVGATIDTSCVPVLDGAFQASANGHLCGGLGRNRDHWLGPAGRERVAIDFAADVQDAMRAALWDPQTSGGLLLAVSPDSAVEMATAFDRAEEPLWRIGWVSVEPGIRVTAMSESPIEPFDLIDPDDVPEIVTHDYGLPRTRAGWRQVLEQLDVRPSKGLGQNFLFERGVVDRIARLAEVSRDDHILEIALASAS